MQRLFNHHGSGYDRLAAVLFAGLHARVVADTAAAVPPGGVLLDVGAGPGRVATGVAARRPDLTVHAVDISPSMVKVAQDRAAAANLSGRVRVALANVTSLPLPDASVDWVVSSVSFHHWADVPAAVQELRRVTRPSGRIWIYDARVAPWTKLTTANGAPVPRTGAGLLFARGDLPPA